MKQTIHRQYCNAKQRLFEAYQRQLVEIDNVANVEFHKYLQKETDLNQVSEIRSKYSHSSSFLLKSKKVLEKVKLAASTEETIWRKPTYIGPKEQFSTFSEEWVTLSRDLFGQCSFDTRGISLDKETHFGSLFRKIIRSQSLVEIPTSPSELLRQKSVSGSMSSLPLTFHTTDADRSTTDEELRAWDQSGSEVCASVVMLLSECDYSFDLCSRLSY